MNTEKFGEIIEEQIRLCQEVLIHKAAEYATEDRLHNFKIAAELQNIPVTTALAGMMAKHTISIYDMCQDDSQQSSLELWTEKITDHINYLLLLTALIKDAVDDVEENH